MIRIMDCYHFIARFKQKKLENSHTAQILLVWKFNCTQVHHIAWLAPMAVQRKHRGSRWQIVEGLIVVFHAGATHLHLFLAIAPVALRFSTQVMIFWLIRKNFGVAVLRMKGMWVNMVYVWGVEGTVACDAAHHSSLNISPWPKRLPHCCPTLFWATGRFGCNMAKR